MDTKNLHHENPDFQRPVAMVTGAAGFIGSYLCELLLLRNCRVIGIDDLSSGRKENLKNCLIHPQFIFKRYDLTKPLDGINRLDYLFHLAGLEVDIGDKKDWSAAVKDYFKGTLQLLKLAEKKEAKFLLASLIGVKRTFLSDRQITKILNNKDLDIRIVRFGFLYGPRMNLKVRDEMTNLIKRTIRGESLEIAGDGSKVIYPTFVADVIYGLSKAMFSVATEGKIFDLVSLESTALYSFAHELQKQSPAEISINFVSPGAYHEEYGFQLNQKIRAGQEELDWRARMGIKEGLSLTLKYFEKKKEGESFSSKPSGFLEKARPLKRKKAKKKKKNSPLFLIAFLVLILLLSSPASLVFDSLLAFKDLFGVQKALTKAEFSLATKRAQRAHRALARANRKVQSYASLFRLINQERVAERVEKIYQVGEKVSQSLVHLGQAAQSTTQLGEIVFKEQPGEIQTLLSQINIQLDFAYHQFSLAEANVISENNLLPVEIPFSEIRSLLLKSQKGIKILPEVIGLEGKRVYLVLLQNNMELRPTGGFIGSFALVTFNKGRLIDFEVQDVYAADGQLKGHVEPPEALKKHLGEAGWYLRDANWHPDFPTSALRAEWFLEKETGRTVAGVIGVDLFLAQNILEQIGEIEVIDFQEKINHQNLFERAEYYSEVGYFPGSTQKKDFLASLTRALFEKVKSSDQEVWLALAQAIYQSLNEKDLLVYLNDPEAMKVIADMDWDGRLKMIECGSTKTACLVDYLMIVEANVGVNKANYFIKRNLTHRTTVNSKGVIEKSLEIQYLNQSRSEIFPAGRYKNYLRVLVPLGSKLESVFIDNNEIKSEKIDQKDLTGKTSFGFLIEVPIQEQKRVVVNYRLGEKINLAQQTHYLFLLQKQPGIKDENFRFLLTAPPGFFLIDPRPDAQQSQSFDPESGQVRASLLFEVPFYQDNVFETGIVK